MAEINTSLGTKLYIGTTGTLSTESSWTEIGKIESFGEFGTKFQTVNFVPVGTGNTEKFKGAKDDGSLTLGLGQLVTDAGQTALKAALADTTGRYNFRIVYNDDPGSASGEEPSMDKFKALVNSYTTNIGDANSVVKSSVELAIITGTLVRTAATT